MSEYHEPWWNYCIDRGPCNCPNRLDRPQEIGWLDGKRMELYRALERGDDVTQWDLFKFLEIIHDNMMVIRSMQKDSLRLTNNCKRWAEVYQGLIKAGNAMAKTEKNGKKQQAWFDAKSHYCQK